MHLFAEGCSDNIMSKLAMEVLSSSNPTVADLRSKIAETENSLWYGNNRNLGKFAGGSPGAGAGAAGGQGGLPQGRFCKPCNSVSHWESQCFGVCPHCSKRGHMSLR